MVASGGERDGDEVVGGAAEVIELTVEVAGLVAALGVGLASGDAGLG